MLTQERYQSILSTIDGRGAVTVSELAEMLGASESTIRRDLTALDEMGRLRKVFGGATSIKQVGSVFEDNFSTKEVLMSEEKTQIAMYCATLINDSDFVFIDAGTTTARLIDFIDNSKATYVTNGIDVAAGFTTPDIEEAMMKEAAVKASYMAFVMADRTKFRRVFPVTFSQLRTCCIITDALPDKSYATETVIKEVMT